MNKIIPLFLTILFLAACGGGEHLRLRADDSGKIKNHIVSYDAVEKKTTPDKFPKITVINCADDAPIVAVLLARADAKPRTYAIEDPYIAPLIAAGLCPVFISYDKIYEQMDFWKPSGILLPGGSFNDLHMYMKNEFEYSPKWDDLKRANAYRAMIDYSYSRRLPLLGICAGHQELGIMLGGKFLDHINVNNKINHKDINGAGHDITITRGTLMHKIAGKDKIRVNTSHNAAIIPGPGPEFKVTAKSADGIIEAIEPKKPWSNFVLGVQWHPERMISDNGPAPGGQKVFDAFINAVRAK
ncbi:MAG: gamma-glutamyl-gamma-aminobutyrate hydrolase family protein [Alphaproteobacteria bacterium]|nr:gamma-glutamyl-gamma-aminobutyrate hydrolase family protein [Alphaproteobacteria bacterium]